MNSTVTTPYVPINDISSFLDKITDLFDNIAGAWSPILFKEGFRQSIVNAWAAVKPTISSIKDQFDNLLKTSVTLLNEAGLTDEQLQLKLDGLNDAWETFKKNGTVKFLKNLLEWINVILGSIAKVIGLSEGLKEFKEAVVLLLEPKE
ncbi:MAG: hypothetical protein HYR94_30720 [Chloroflexi bacterium]|nr:hypothetical protein [Chloroflexota bacterium]